mgnify:CR=1 FL=1
MSKVNVSDKNNATTAQIYALVEAHHSDTVKDGPEFTDVSAQDLQWIMDHLDFLKAKNRHNVNNFRQMLVGIKEGSSSVEEVDAILKGWNK